MQIDLIEVSIRDLTEGYTSTEADGVVGYSGMLDIRPAYQREFVYSEEQQKAVLESVAKGFPLNVMYWADDTDNAQGKDYELIDGQQRTLSICSFVKGEYSVKFDGVNAMYMHTLKLSDEALYNKILDYKLLVYVCKGTDIEKLAWFKTINITGEKLTPQELINAVYTGNFLTEAKKKFSKPNCAIHNSYKMYLTGSAIRQQYLETAIKWIITGIENCDSIQEYMAMHQFDDNADELFNYIESVFEWVQGIFGKKSDYARREMKGIEWGILYNKYKDKEFNQAEVIAQVDELMKNDEIRNKKGIYLYILSNQSRHLNLRAFSSSQSTTMYEKQNGICLECGGHFEIGEMEADHKRPWSEGGITTLENGQMLCRACNRQKSNH